MDMTTSITYTRVHDSYSLEAVVAGITTELTDADTPHDLLIVDGMLALYCRNYCGGELALRQRRLGMVMYKLKEIADTYNVPVLITNEVDWNDVPAMRPVTRSYERPTLPTRAPATFLHRNADDLMVEVDDVPAVEDLGDPRSWD